MTTILLTRPLKASQHLAHKFELAGYHTVIEPLLSIRPTMEPLILKEKIQSILITSVNALSVPLSRDISFMFPLPCYCVGTPTSIKSQQYGFVDVHNAESDSEKLARLIRERMPLNKGQLLHIGGRHISSHALAHFAKEGLTPFLWPVYEAYPTQELSSETLQLIKENKLHIILVFSVRTAQTLCQLLKESHLTSYCKRITVIGLSVPIRDTLACLTWKLCIIASEPTEESIIARLKDLSL